MKCGLLPLSQEACLIGDVSYHSYNGIVIDPEERESLAKDLGPNNKVSIRCFHKYHSLYFVLNMSIVYVKCCI